MAARAFARVAPVRAKVSLAIVLLLALGLVARLADVQIREGPALARKALAQHDETHETFARRGAILDRDGGVLVRSLPSESIYAVPDAVTNKHESAVALAPLLHRPVAAVEADLQGDGQFRWLARKVPHEVAEQVRALGLTGIATEPEETGIRFVAAGRLASTVIGFTGTDENGLDGLEYSLDKVLRGTPGRERIEADEFGHAIPFGETQVIERAVPGTTVVTTLDPYLQYEAERLLAADVKQWHAASGSVVVMDPWTGELLAMANVPDFDPSHFARSSSDTWRDRAISDAYEPGSTFKLITAAAALESGKVTTASRFPTHDQITVGGHTIHNAEDGFLAGTSSNESMEDVIAYSHNVGAAEIALKIGAHAMADEIARFGFGDPTQVELPGENPGIVPPLADWSGSSLATIAFGQGISVEPLALIRAYCAIANGGLLLRPRIVHAFENAKGDTIYTYGPEIERRVISEHTAAILRGFLRAVVVRGTGNPTARVPGWTTAGKTGTAQIEEHGVYEPGAYVASFIGMIPAESPRYVILVKIDRPRGAYYGGTVAAPVFAQLARDAMFHAGIMPAAPPRLVRHAAASKAKR
ncbi:MAG TPA: penicillin-binding protein 2 [Candidatus Sulfotelmatobacter sp.]|nr:penicillin-binding protein 2 [Candidatus Sulfotelmatobacter sp.]